MKKASTIFTLKGKFSSVALKLFVIFAFLIVSNKSFADVVAVNPFAATIETFNESNWTSLSVFPLTLSGFTITGATAVTWNSDNLLYYAIVKVSGSSPNPRRLVTVDPNTGVCTDIGLMDNTSYSSLTYNSNSGVMYTMTGSGGGTSNERLFSVNLTTAATTFLGGPYSVGNFGEVIAYNYDDDRIYHWSSGGMESINPSTFVATTVTMSGALVDEVQGAVYKGAGIFVLTDLVFLGPTSAFTITSAGVATSVASTPYQARGLAYANPLLPVELSSFVSSVSGNNITLNWSTSSEINNQGFDIEKSFVNGSWSKIGNVNGNGTTTTGHSYSFNDRNVATGNYSYRLKQIDFNGNFEYFNLSANVNVGTPERFELSQNYPNPFNPSTKINYDLPFDSKVSIKLFDISGKEVMTILNDSKTAGYYSVNFNGTSLSSGIYFYSITAEGNGQNFVSTKKMTLIK